MSSIVTETKVWVKLNQYGIDLSSKSLAKEILEKNDVNSRNTLMIDFKDVVASNFSFLTELLDTMYDKKVNCQIVNVNSTILKQLDEIFEKDNRNESECFLTMYIINDPLKYLTKEQKKTVTEHLDKKGLQDAIDKELERRKKRYTKDSHSDKFENIG